MWESGKCLTATMMRSQTIPLNYASLSQLKRLLLSTNSRNCSRMESEGGVLGEEKMISVSANNALRLMFWMRGPLRQQSKQIAYTLMKMC